jgi:hypothetical protein
MSRKRGWYNLRIVVSVFLSIATAISFANFYLDLGYFGKLSKGILFGLGLIGLFYALFLTPSKAEFREHGWWWKEG